MSIASSSEDICIAMVSRSFLSFSFPLLFLDPEDKVVDSHGLFGVGGFVWIGGKARDTEATCCLICWCGCIHFSKLDREHRSMLYLSHHLTRYLRTNEYGIPRRNGMRL